MIRRDDHGDLVLLWLDRSDKANALTRAMLADLDAAVEQAVQAGAKAIILIGTGKVFSAGADLDEMQTGLALAPEWERLSGRIAAAPCLTIAALNGTLAGGAFGMALACDLRVCVPGTQFFYPVMKRGFLPQPSDPKRLAALVGPSRARLILLAGARIDAAEALTWGLVDRMADGPDPLPVARALAADALAASRDHGRALKALF